MGWNGSIAPGQSVSFGFQGNTNGGTVERPVVNGTLCGAAVSSSSRSSVAVTSSSRSSVAPSSTPSSAPATSSRSSAAVSSVNNSVPANNFAQNGGVESGLTNWGTTAGTVTRSTADKRSGSASALITGRTAAWNGLTFNVGSLTTGNEYALNVWVKLAPGTPDSVITLTA
ncbi:carbohydrate binding domain-containing protein, partial [Cellvibrio mixtus]|uniref:carbohydrate binding domain-containing protein n=1 Tax=Cellvibrio mixtus TaxID=39650 RepID=UPI00058750CE